MFHKLLDLLSICFFLKLAFSQDECNALPLRGHIDLPLRTYVPQTLDLTNTTICDKYAPKNSTQLDWIRKLVNMAFVGNFAPVKGPKWPEDPKGIYQSTGILDPNAQYKDPCNTLYPVNLVQYFNGSLRSTNRGEKAVALDFLDGGSIIALRENVPAWDAQSNQYKMMTGFYNYFGNFFGCSDGSIPIYTGSASQTHIHRFMDLPSVYIHYFIHSIVNAATSLGLPEADTVTHVGDGISIGIALDNIFNKRCSPPQPVLTYQPAALQNMCADVATCAPWTFPNATCSAYNFTGFEIPPERAIAWEAKIENCGVSRQLRRK